MIAQVRALHDRRGRRKHGAYLVEGERIVAELAGSTATIRFAFAVPASMSRLRRLLPAASLYLAPPHERRLFATESPQGMGAVVDLPEPPDRSLLADRGRPLLHLEGIADPGNLGTTLRTADWFGHESIALGVGSVDPFNPKTVRASMGAIFRLPIATDVALETLLATGRPMFALDVEGSDIRTAPLPRDGIYVIGQEAHGLSPETRGVCELIAIAGAGNADSLNAAMAATILLYELAGRRDAATRSAVAGW